jgi:hypothetical protein
MSIENDEQFQITQERLTKMRNMLLSLRREASSPAAYRSMSQAFLVDIEKMERDLKDYLEKVPQTAA